MKKTLIITLVALGAIALASSAFAVISGSAHDLSTGTTSGLSACEYCHTPHNAVGTVGTTTRTPLWNRSNPQASTFTGYGTTVSSTTTTAINTNSLTCMSCHDGATAMNNVFNKKLEGSIKIADGASTYANIGTNLSNDHPVSFTYQTDKAGVPQAVFQYLGSSTTSTWNGQHKFRLYGAGTFECASCHDPHDTTTGAVADVGPGAPGRSDYFLRAPFNTICVDCHMDK